MLRIKLHPFKTKMHPPLNRNCTPLTGFYQNQSHLPKETNKSKKLGDFEMWNDAEFRFEAVRAFINSRTEIQNEIE